jgi:hypothetical protein
MKKKFLLLHIVRIALSRNILKIINRKLIKPGTSFKFLTFRHNLHPLGTDKPRACSHHAQPVHRIIAPNGDFFVVGESAFFDRETYPP